MNGEFIINWIIKYLRKENKLCYDSEILRVLRKLDNIMIMQITHLGDLDKKEYEQLKEAE